MNREMESQIRAQTLLWMTWDATVMSDDSVGFVAGTSCESGFYIKIADTVDFMQNWSCTLENLWPFENTLGANCCHCWFHCVRILDEDTRCCIFNVT